MTAETKITPEYLLTIPSVRAQSTKVFAKSLQNNLENFSVDVQHIPEVVDFIVELIRRDYGTDYSSIPPHGRWQHFEVGSCRLDELIAAWEAQKMDKEEITRKLIDLFVVSVLLDAGAGNYWKYIEESTGQVIDRSEGIAVASFHMFIDGYFSESKGDESSKCQVNGSELLKFTEADLKTGFQVNDENPLEGVTGRAALLAKLGQALLSNETFFGKTGRPGNMIDYLKAHSTSGDSTSIELEDVWRVLMEGFSTIWPSGRTQIDGKSLGDAWPIKALGYDGEHVVPEVVVPFHKLTQWLCYSLLVPMKKILGWEIRNEGLQTGLPEYRNGGLFVDFHVLTLKPDVLTRGLKQSVNSGIPAFAPDDDVIIEWRAATVGFLDYLLPLVNDKLSIAGTPEALTLPQLLEAGTWKAGREIAAKLRPETKGPPIDLISDGTVF